MSETKSRLARITLAVDREQEVGPVLRQSAAWSTIRAMRPAPVRGTKSPHGNLVAAMLGGTRTRVRATDPQKRAANSAVQRAVADGTLAKPDHCSRCQEPVIASQLHGHHEDYDKPLDVAWLCAECHARIHAIKKGHTFLAPTVT